MHLSLTRLLLLLAPSSALLQVHTRLAKAILHKAKVDAMQQREALLAQAELLFAAAADIDDALAKLERGEAVAPPPVFTRLAPPPPEAPAETALRRLGGRVLRVVDFAGDAAATAPRSARRCARGRTRTSRRCWATRGRRGTRRTRRGGRVMTSKLSRSSRSARRSKNPRSVRTRRARFCASTKEPTSSPGRIRAESWASCAARRSNASATPTGLSESVLSRASSPGKRPASASAARVEWQPRGVVEREGERGARGRPEEVLRSTQGLEG